MKCISVFSIILLVVIITSCKNNVAPPNVERELPSIPAPEKAPKADQAVLSDDQLQQSLVISANPENLLVNGDFESFDSWTACGLGGSLSLSNDAHAGNTAASLSTDCFYQSINVSPNQTFSLSCFAKRTQDGWTGLGFTFSDINWQELGGAAPTQEIRDSTYRQYSTTATAPANSSYLTVWAYTDGEVLIDSCQLFEGTAPPPSGNLLVNPSFENDQEGWFACGSAANITIVNDPSDGNKAIQVSNSGCLYQDLQAIGGSKYNLNCQAKYDASGWATLILSFLDSNWQSIVSDYRVIQGTNYQDYSISMDAPANAAHAAVTFYSEPSTSYDACSLSVESAPPPSNPAIDIRIQAEGPDSQEVTSGGSANFEVEVRNTGNVTLTNVTVVNSAAIASCDKNIGDLAVGANVTYTCSKDNITNDFTTIVTASGEYNGSTNIEDSDETTVKVKNISPQCTTNASYIIIFDATWSATTHPVDFPPDPHFSDLVGVSHKDSVSFWQEGGLASPGIEAMAEEGATATLINEVNSAIAAGKADQMLLGDYISSSPGSTSLQFDLSPDFPEVTLVSMVAPSPDWFVGVSRLELCENGVWVNSKSVDLFAFDAGTDSGTTYTSDNIDTNPQEAISQLTTGVFEVGGVVPKLGTFTFTLQSNPPVANPGIDIRLQAEGEDKYNRYVTGDFNVEIAVRNKGDISLSNINVTSDIPNCSNTFATLAVSEIQRFNCTINVSLSQDQQYTVTTSATSSNVSTSDSDTATIKHWPIEAPNPAGLLRIFTDTTNVVQGNDVTFWINVAALGNITYIKNITSNIPDCNRTLSPAVSINGQVVVYNCTAQNIQSNLTATINTINNEGGTRQHTLTDSIAVIVQ